MWRRSAPQVGRKPQVERSHCHIVPLHPTSSQPRPKTPTTQLHLHRMPPTHTVLNPPPAGQMSTVRTRTASDPLNYSLLHLFHLIDRCLPLPSFPLWAFSPEHTTTLAQP